MRDLSLETTADCRAVGLLLNSSKVGKRPKYSTFRAKTVTCSTRERHSLKNLLLDKLAPPLKLRDKPVSGRGNAVVDKADVCGVEKSHAKDLRRCHAKSVRLFMIHLGRHVAQVPKVIVSRRRFGSGPPLANSVAADAKSAQGEAIRPLLLAEPPAGGLLAFPRLFPSSLRMPLPLGSDLLPQTCFSEVHLMS